MKKMNTVAWTFLLLLVATTTSQAQGFIDGFFSEQGALSVTTSYTHGSFDEFYLGTKKTDGVPAHEKITQDIYDIYAKYEVFGDLVAFVNVPFIVAEGEGVADPVNGKKKVSGIQDITLGLKYRIHEFEYENSQLSLLSSFAVELPGDYNPNGILSIGTGALAADIGTGFHFHHDKGVFTTVLASYSFKDDHQDNGDFNVPSVFASSAKIGYANRYFYVDGWFEFLNSTSGVDIEGAGFDGNFPETRVSYSKVGASFYKKFNDKLGLNLAAGTILNGRNVGKATTFTVGLTYEIQLL